MKDYRLHLGIDFPVLVAMIFILNACENSVQRDHEIRLQEMIKGNAHADADGQ